ncbi:hypothetical protein V8E36_008416 [Tilletia maclaganii]
MDIPPSNPTNNPTSKGKEAAGPAPKETDAATGGSTTGASPGDGTPEQVDLGLVICGSADSLSTGKLVAMIRARRCGSASELKVTKKFPDLTGAHDFIIWRNMLLGLFVPYMGGRYWHLLERDPSTSVAGYQLIFADDDEHPISREEASSFRTADLIAIHGLLLQTLHPDVMQGLDEGTTAGNFDGVKLWDALTANYGGKDLGSKRAAEKALREFQLGNLTVTAAAQQIQALFTQIYLTSGGRPVSEHDKIEVALTVFNVDRFRAMRTSIQEAWQNGRPYTFHEVISRFLGEEALSLGDNTASTNATGGARALVAQSGRDRAPTTSGGNRPNPQRRRGGVDVECWHCGNIGHLERACRQKKAGKPPYPNSRSGRSTRQQGQPSSSLPPPASRDDQPASDRAQQTGPHQTAFDQAWQANAMLAAACANLLPRVQQPFNRQAIGAPPSLASRISEVPAPDTQSDGASSFSRLH